MPVVPKTCLLLLLPRHDVCQSRDSRHTRQSAGSSQSLKSSTEPLLLEGCAAQLFTCRSLSKIRTVWQCGSPVFVCVCVCAGGAEPSQYHVDIETIKGALVLHKIFVAFHRRSKRSTQDLRSVLLQKICVQEVLRVTAWTRTRATACARRRAFSRRRE
jgi:hypothetical protein